MAARCFASVFSLSMTPRSVTGGGARLGSVSGLSGLSLPRRARPVDCIYPPVLWSRRVQLFRRNTILVSGVSGAVDLSGQRQPGSATRRKAAGNGHHDRGKIVPPPC